MTFAIRIYLAKLTFLLKNTINVLSPMGFKPLHTKQWVKTLGNI